MAYIGKTPTIGNFQVCDAISTVNAQAAYTMQVGGVNVSPESANHMLVSLNGILQAPTSSFTVSGSTITFASNLVTGDVIDFIQILGNVLDLGVPSDSTVSLAKLSATGTKDATTFLRGDNTFAAPPLGGITDADQWRVTVDFNLSTTATDITANLERNDTDFGLIGDGMTQSSGVFTFPSTGIYMVKTFANMGVGGAGGSRYHKIMILTTTDNSAYNIRAEGSSTTSIADGQSPVYCELIFDVTNTSLCKVKFQTQKYSASYNTSFGVSTNANFNAFTFIRLGDT